MFVVFARSRRRTQSKSLFVDHLQKLMFLLQFALSWKLRDTYGYSTVPEYSTDEEKESRRIETPRATPQYAAE